MMILFSITSQSTEHCSNCIALIVTIAAHSRSPAFEELSTHLAEEGSDVQICRLDVTLNPEVPHQLGVKETPTFVYFSPHEREPVVYRGPHPVTQAGLESFLAERLSKEHPSLRHIPLPYHMQRLAQELVMALGRHPTTTVPNWGEVLAKLKDLRHSLEEDALTPATKASRQLLAALAPCLSTVYPLPKPGDSNIATPECQTTLRRQLAEEDERMRTTPGDDDSETRRGIVEWLVDLFAHPREEGPPLEEDEDVPLAELPITTGPPSSPATPSTTTHVPEHTGEAVPLVPPIFRGNAKPVKATAPIDTSIGPVEAPVVENVEIPPGSLPPPLSDTPKKEPLYASRERELEPLPEVVHQPTGTAATGKPPHTHHSIEQ
ncbi:hypothetical protein PAPYR_846 [Paratrimastix pyriformis]|uniref:Thioredoxin domain-containing protein n=1 Tax=Paratrimastix pyriformis TaxID=342808 RepID=A0ABQ8UXZ3_9EUKA|nr:hypothetical protein PAPYR_846 [Paratrimastix pyriformis]